MLRGSKGNHQNLSVIAKNAFCSEATEAELGVANRSEAELGVANLFLGKTDRFTLRSRDDDSL
jgi:hypothetical protein